MRDTESLLVAARYSEKLPECYGKLPWLGKEAGSFNQEAGKWP